MKVDLTKNPGPKKPGAWSSSIFACASAHQFFMAWFCPCVLHGQNAEEMQRMFGDTDSSSENSMNMFVFGACCYLFPWPFYGACLTYDARKSIREKYGISGNSYGDCLNHFCLPCCSVAQEAREIEYHKRQHLLRTTVTQVPGQLPPFGFGGPDAGSPQSAVMMKPLSSGSGSAGNFAKPVYIQPGTGGGGAGEGYASGYSQGVLSPASPADGQQGGRQGTGAGSPTGTLNF